MSDVVVAVITVLAGSLLCVRGCAAMRAAVPAAAAVGGFLLGASIVHVGNGTTMLGTPLAWLAGAVGGVAVGLASWLWFEVAVTVALSAIGFAATVATLAAFGLTWSWPTVSIGALVGALLGLLCVVADLPTVLLAAVTALAGSATLLTGVLLLGASLGTADLASPDTTTRIPHASWWAAAWLLLAMVGVVVQLRTTTGDSLRDRFVDAGGRQLRET
ncbi:MAG: hypothetical protein RI900_1931 [Actinomycetota bacterium]